MNYEKYLNKQKEFFRTHELVTGKRLFYSALLCIFFGFLGVHNFYNHRYRKGLFQLLLYILFFVFSLGNYSRCRNIFDIFIFTYVWSGLLLFGYDLILMCCKRYYAPILGMDNNHLSVPIYKMVVNDQKGDKNFDNVKLEIGNKSRACFLLLASFGAAIGLPFLYINHRPSTYFCLIFLIIILICITQSYGMYGGELMVFFPLFHFLLFISCLQERLDGEGKLFMPAKNVWFESLMVIICFFIALCSLIFPGFVSFWAFLYFGYC